MKKVFYLISILFITSCNTENAPDCFKAEGTILQSEISVTPFSKIIVNKKIQLFIKEGAEYKVVLETGENIINEVTIKVTDSILSLTNNIGCNFVRDYGITKVYVTAPNIKEVRNNSSLTVSSIGMLTYPNLVLLSEDHENEEFYNNGDFILDLDVEDLTITANGFSNFFLTGSATKAQISLYSGNSRVEAADFLIQELIVFHRSSNKMIVNPQESIIGEIRSLGDIISKNEPPVVNVAEYYTGRLIFN
tara:strand:- start:6864 stop:7610 length:747 start_codon:yes stop_codon:yes gene_type:complete